MTARRMTARRMTARRAMIRLAAGERLNFLLTNRLPPRRLATRLVGWLSRIEQPLIARALIALWRRFGDIDLADAETTRFASMHACFVRRLRPGARAIDLDPSVLASPCDAIVGAGGPIAGDSLLQVKGSPYSLAELLGDAAVAARLAGGRYLTLRLTAGMYHHFHAPHDLTVERVRYLPGDCWNVNPAALKRVPRLFCRNERAAIHCRLDGGARLVLVAVAAILVAGIRLRFVEGGLRALADDQLALGVRARKGEEMGWFEHGSTIVLLVPPGFTPAPEVQEGRIVRMGTALFRRAEQAGPRPR